MNYLSNLIPIRLPNQQATNSAARQGKIDLLTWLVHHNIYPGLTGINAAASHGHIEILEKLNVLPNVIGVIDAIINKQWYVLLWLIQEEVELSAVNINRLIDIGCRYSIIIIYIQINFQQRML